MRDYVFCGRGSPYGNQFRVGIDGNRKQVIAKHKAWLHSNPAFMEQVRRELTGKILGCYCKPKECHCDNYVEVCDE